MKKFLKFIKEAISFYIFLVYVYFYVLFKKF